MKFGGSSVRDAERIREVCELIRLTTSSGVRPHVVCSGARAASYGPPLFPRVGRR